MDTTLDFQNGRRRFVSYFTGDTVGALIASTLAGEVRSQNVGLLGDGHQWYLATKRVFDFLLSLIALAVLSPVFLLAAISVKLYDRGPVLFSQERVGKNGRTFRCYKFRSMVTNAERLQKELIAQNEHADPRTFKMSNDPRITPVGRILRRFSIDEFPQIFNVLLGQMSIVGPRPPLPREVALYSHTDFQRLAVKPGLTCIWQVSGRSRLSFPEEVKMDVHYIQTQSIAKDITIILKTIPAVLSGDGAA
ncbi:MAG: sugar transferase [Fuerstiella sp.]